MTRSSLTSELNLPLIQRNPEHPPVDHKPTTPGNCGQHLSKRSSITSTYINLWPDLIASAIISQIASPPTACVAEAFQANQVFPVPRHNFKDGLRIAGAGLPACNPAGCTYKLPLMLERNFRAHLPRQRSRAPIALHREASSCFSLKSRPVRLLPRLRSRKYGFVVEVEDCTPVRVKVVKVFGEGSSSCRGCSVTPSRALSPSLYGSSISVSED